MKIRIDQIKIMPVKVQGIEISGVKTGLFVLAGVFVLILWLERSHASLCVIKTKKPYEQTLLIRRPWR
jgi:hypothetical protein